MKYSVLIPVYNSEKSLAQITETIARYFSEANDAFEIVYVDDFSSDHSWTTIQRLSQAFSFVKGIHLRANYGQQMALYTGLHSCSGEWVITMDDDLQHSVQSIGALIEVAKQGSDLVFGVYAHHGNHPVRALGSRAIGGFFKNNYPKLEEKRVSSLRLVHQSVFRPICHQTKSFVYLSAELIPYANNIENVVVTRYPRVYGKSGYTLMKCLEIALKLNLFYGAGSFIHPKGGEPIEKRIDGRCGELSDQLHFKVESLRS